MCIPENEICPINDIKIDLASNKSLYELKGYESTPFNNLQEGYVLYFTNNATEKEIISKLFLSNETPLYILTEIMRYTMNKLTKIMKNH